VERCAAVPWKKNTEREGSLLISGWTGMRFTGRICSPGRRSFIVLVVSPRSGTVASCRRGYTHTHLCFESHIRVSRVDRANICATRMPSLTFYVIHTNIRCRGVFFSQPNGRAGQPRTNFKICTKRGRQRKEGDPRSFRSNSAACACAKTKLGNCSYRETRSVKHACHCCLTNRVLYRACTLPRGRVIVPPASSVPFPTTASRFSMPGASLSPGTVSSAPSIAPWEGGEAIRGSSSAGKTELLGSARDERPGNPQVPSKIKIYTTAPLLNKANKA